MKKVFILIAVLAAAVCISCKQDPEKGKINPVYFESFGFTSETTPDLGEGMDYIVTNLSRTNQIDIVLDASTIPEVIDTLRPVFTFPELPEGEEVIVTVDDEPVISGETKMDFNKPVEFRLQKGSDNALYTVNVSIEPSNFTRVAMMPEKDTLYNDVRAQITAKDEIWIGGFLRTKGDARNFPVLYKFANGSLGDKIVLSEERVALPVALGVDPEGNPYLSANTYASGKAAQMTMFKYSGGKTSLVGERDAVYRFASSVGPTCVLPVSSNNIFTCGTNNTKQGTLARYSVNIAEFNGTSWSNNVKPIGLTQDANGVAYSRSQSYAKLVNGIPYIAVKQYGSAGNINCVTLIRNNAGTWETIVEGLTFKSADGKELASLGTYFFDFDIDSKGIPYFLIAAQFIGEDYQPAVIKYDPTSKSQTILGGLIGFTVGLTDRPSLKLDKNDKPYVAYAWNDGTNRTFISYIDDNTKLWIKPERVTDETAGDPVILFDSKNNIYVITDIKAHAAVYAHK